MLTGPRTGGPRRQTAAAALRPQRRRLLKAPVWRGYQASSPARRPVCPQVIVARMIARQLAVTRIAGRHQRTTSLRRVNRADRAAAGGASRNVTEALVTTSK